MTAAGTTEGSPDALRSAAPGFRDAGTHLQSAHDTLRGAEDRLGTCWGDDEGGTKFGESYLAGVASFDAVLKQVVQSLADTTTGLTTAADGLTQVEQSHTDAHDTVAKEV